MTHPTIVPSYSGFGGGQTVPATPPVCTTTATKFSPVGSYPSTCSGASDPNYTFTYVAGSVTVTSSVVGYGTYIPGKQATTIGPR